MANTANQHRPFRMPGEGQEEFEARMAEHAARVEQASSPAARGPQWQNPNEQRKAVEPKVPRDYVAKARAAINAADQTPTLATVLGAVIVAQALDRLADKITEAAAIVNYKRSP